MKKKCKKLKLTRLTIADLNRLKGGRPPCDCDAAIGNGPYNRDTMSFQITVCPC